MTLEDLFGGPQSISKPPEALDGSGAQSNVRSPLRGSEGPLRGREQEEPYGVSEVTTPSGIEIYYQAGPKRLYRIGDRRDPLGLIEVPSVSDVKGILEKQLSYWGYRCGVAASAHLLQDAATHHLARKWLETEDPDEIIAKNAKGFTDLAKAHKLDPNNRKNRAGDRGTSVHDALEAWAERGVMPIPEVYPETERGYVRGLVAFLEESGIQAVRSEAMVGSLEHGYAGRFDLDAYSVGNEVCVHLTEKGKGDRRAVIEPGLLRLDLKTSSNVYTEHYLQLAAYELAAVECGYEPSDDRVVVNVWPDGRYQAKVSKATAEDWLAVLGAYRALERIKGAK